jgi:tetratricopeptide (TPR) repeat protein
MMNRPTRLLIGALLFASLLAAGRLYPSWRTNRASVEVVQGTPPETTAAVDSWLQIGDLDPKAAEQHLTRYLELYPENAVAGFKLGEIYLEQGRREAAIQQWSQITGADHRLASLAWRALNIPDLEQATDWATLSQSVNPNATSERRLLYDALCQAWQSLNVDAESLSWCRLAAESNANGWAQARYARLLISDGRLAEAEIQLSLGLSYDTIDATGTLYQILGGLYLRQGADLEAQNAYLEALAHDQQTRFVYYGLAEVSLRQGELEAACDYLGRAIDAGHDLTQAETERYAECPDLSP